MATEKTTTLLVNYFRKKLHRRFLTGCLLHVSKSMVVVAVLVVGLLRVRLFGNFDNPKRKNKYPNNLFLRNFILSKYSRRFWKNLSTDATTGGVLWKKMFSKISQNSLENICVGEIICVYSMNLFQRSVLGVCFLSKCPWV